MSRLRRLELLDPFSHFYPSSFSSSSSSLLWLKEGPIFPPFFLEEDELLEDLTSAVSVFNPVPDPFDLFETVTDLIRVERAHPPCAYRRVLHRRRANPERLLLEGLCDRVSALEERFGRVVVGEDRETERKYTWTAEIKAPVAERKYRWSAEIEGGKKEEAKRSYKWTAEIKGKGEDARKYTFEMSNAEKKKKKEEKKKKDNVEKKKVGATSSTRLVEIEEPSPDLGTIFLKQV